ncbi:MAG: ABC transporter substrate-binding protein [Oscillospiraceae bacterium]|nr:ABC transporter substrate-binding protein [Oscillospiraceae bacterium]MCD7817513.1 ABC transporter substrate-binding protein [Lachnospiraceae bacterium]
MKKRCLALLLVMVMTISLLSSCSNSGKSEVENDESKTTDIVESDNDLSETTEPIVVNYAFASTWNNLNVLNPTSSYVVEIGNFIFDRIASQTQDGWVAEAAESWTFSEDNMSVTIVLRDDMYFHDGEPVTVNDLKTAFRVNFDEDAVCLTASKFNLISGTDDNGYCDSLEEAGIVFEDDYTVTINFKEPCSEYTFFTNIVPYLWILPEHILADYDTADFLNWDFWTAPIGSGPCVFSEELAGTEALFYANDNYYLGTLQFDQLHLTVVDSSTQVAQLLAGTIDYDNNGLEYDAVTSLEGVEGITNEVREGPGYMQFLLINNDTVDTELRKALNYCIDKEVLVDSLLNGYGEVAATAVLSTNEYYIDLYEGVQLEKADECLANSDYDGRTLVVGTTSARENIVVMLQQMWSAAGISVEIQTGDVATCISGLMDGTIDMCILGSTSTNDVVWHYSQGFADGNMGNVESTGYTELYNAYVNATTEDEQHEAAIAYTQYVYDNMPCIYLFHKFNFYPHASWISGFGAIGMDEAYNWVIDADAYYASH